MLTSNLFYRTKEGRGGIRFASPFSILLSGLYTWVPLASAVGYFLVEKGHFGADFTILAPASVCVGDHHALMCAGPLQFNTFVLAEFVAAGVMASYIVKTALRFIGNIEYAPSTRNNERLSPLLFIVLAIIVGVVGGMNQAVPFAAVSVASIVLAKALIRQPILYLAKSLAYLNVAGAKAFLEIVDWNTNVWPLRSSIEPQLEEVG
ncbi:MAG: hypothetical protein WDN10_00355 [bacterium]